MAKTGKTASAIDKLQGKKKSDSKESSTLTTTTHVAITTHVNCIQNVFTPARLCLLLGNIKPTTHAQPQQREINALLGGFVTSMVTKKYVAGEQLTYLMQRICPFMVEPPTAGWALILFISIF